MKLSYFAQPAHPPGRSIKQVVDWNLQVIRWCEDIGFDEFWMGEHFTDSWEPIPAPDLILAQALMETERIKLGPAGHCLPYHHPVALAHRIAMLDHMAQGRYQFGVASGVIPTDLLLYGIDATNGQHRAMTAEALDIILRVWAHDDQPFDYDGHFWKVHLPPAMFDDHFRVHLKPFQQPHPPIAMTGFTPYSGTLKLAASKGYIPMSLNMSPSYVATHWEAIKQGAESTGRTPSRQDWRILREVFVAETDAEARRWAVDGPMGQAIGEYTLPLLRDLGALPLLKRDPDTPDDDITVEWLADNCWLVGSPETVVEKFERMYEELGGFGHLMFLSFDFSEHPEVWQGSMELFATEVLPKISHLKPADD